MVYVNNIAAANSALAESVRFGAMSGDDPRGSVVSSGDGEAIH